MPIYPFWLEYLSNSIIKFSKFHVKFKKPFSVICVSMFIFLKCLYSLIIYCIEVICIKNICPAQVTGIYDEATMTAVSQFQKQNHLAVDGLAGIATMQVCLYECF